MKYTKVALMFGIPYVLASTVIRGGDVLGMVLPFIGVSAVGIICDGVAYLWRERSNSVG